MKRWTKFIFVILFIVFLLGLAKKLMDYLKEQGIIKS